MKVLSVAASAVAVSILAGCAASPELVGCLQPNRRVTVEVSGIKIKPPPKNKPHAKPGRQTVLLRALAQGDSAWAPGSAELKADGKAELDKLVKTIQDGTKRDKRPTKVGSVIITGYTDRIEAEDGKTDLDVDRARAVMNYLVAKGLDPKLMFWEGKDAKDPVPVTKFCES